MTERLYENDSYLKEFDAWVVSCRQLADAEMTPEERTQGKALYLLELDRTAFFPEGGGQNADRGRIDGCEVSDVQIKDGIVYHRTALEAVPGQKVRGEIDWDNRFSNMQQHSGEHIFSGLVHRHFGYNNVGFHLGSQVVTMDFDGPLSLEDIERLEYEVNGAIGENVPITVSYPDDEQLKNLAYRSKIEIEGQVRIVTVQGYDVCACCAPHVAYTGAIGGLKVVDFQKYKGGTRVSILCGLRALKDYQMKQSQAECISRQLSVPVDHVADAVRRQADEISALRQEIYRLTEDIIMKDVDAVEDGAQNIWFFRENLEAPVMRKIVNKTLEKISGYCGVFCGNDGDGYKYIIGTKSGDARTVAKILQEALGVRGGGSAQMIQGAAKASKAAIMEVLPE